MRKTRVAHFFLQNPLHFSAILFTFALEISEKEIFIINDIINKALAINNGI